MNDHGDEPGGNPDDDKAHNQGEGDRESARVFNEAAKAFVKSPRGRAAIDEAGDVSDEELEELADAEKAGRERAKGEDPAVTRNPSKPGRSDA